MVEVHDNLGKIMERMGLLEELKCKISEEQFVSFWSAFAHPSGVYTASSRCLKRMGEFEQVYCEDLNT